MKLTETSIRTTMLHYDLSLYMVAGMVNYLVNHIEPGSFMLSLLENDFTGAVRRADPENRVKLRTWVSFLEREVPLRAWGSRIMVRLWLEDKPKKEET